MFAKLKQQMNEFLRDMEQRDELVESLNNLLQSDTDRLLDIEYIRMEDYALNNGIANVAESEYAHIRGTVGLGDYSKEFNRYSDETLRLLAEARDAACDVGDDAAAADALAWSAIHAVLAAGIMAHAPTRGEKVS
jgi:hypothetical protein